MKRGRGRTKILGCALALTTAAAAAFGSVAAVALGAQGGSQATPEAPPLPAEHPAQPVATQAAVPRFVVRHVELATPAGSTVTVRGFLRPNQRGARVKLVARYGRTWRTLAVAHTVRNGRFGIRYTVRAIGATHLRVEFAGTHRVRAASAPAGQIIGMAPIVASWYSDAGHTACGFHATFGVANRTLPCGTKVTLAYAGRNVVATVDDRGPYVYGRSFDLNQNTARILGMWGVSQVFASA